MLNGCGTFQYYSRDQKVFKVITARKTGNKQVRYHCFFQIHDKYEPAQPSCMCLNKLPSVLWMLRWHFSCVAHNCHDYDYILFYPLSSCFLNVTAHVTDCCCSVGCPGNSVNDRDLWQTFSLPSFCNCSLWWPFRHSSVKAKKKKWATRAVRPQCWEL